MSINKELCHSILKELEAIYPDTDKGNVLVSRLHDDFRACSEYLVANGLIVGQWYQPPGTKRNLVRMKITKMGLDYLTEDGGLTAKLNTITVRFDEATLRSLLTASITRLDASPTQKERLLETLRNTPGHVVQELSVKLLDQLLSRTPEALVLLGKLLG